MTGVARADVHRFPVRVYFEDTDFSGAVYHAQYLKFFERARTEFLRARGVHHSQLREQGLFFVVRRMAIDFLAPGAIDDLLEVETGVHEVGGARVVLDQALSRDGTTLARARVTVALVGPGGRPSRFGPALRAALAPAAG